MSALRTAGAAEPTLPRLDKPYAMLVTGVGGTGVVTHRRRFGQAAHLEGKGFGAIDMTGLAQKGGAVALPYADRATAEKIHAIRARAGGADLVLGCDLVVSRLQQGVGGDRAGPDWRVLNTAEVYPGDFTRNADFRSRRSVSGARSRRGRVSPRASSMPRVRRLNCSATRSPPTCSCLASRISGASCRSSRAAIDKRSSSTARR